MEKLNLDFFRELLMTQLDALSNHVRRTTSNLINEEDQHFTEYVDMASFDEDQALRFRIYNRESNLIKKIQMALRRIEDGEFGICEGCGKDIPLKRLMARPVTTKCIRCKTKEERIEKVAGF